MAVARYRPDHDVTFDLVHGLVHLEGAPGRVLVPASALAGLCGAADPGSVAAFGKAIGHSMGLRVAKRLSPIAEVDESGRAAGARGASVETMVDHLGAELSLVGLGSLGMERWGRALVVVVDHCPLGGPGDALLESVIGEAIGAATARNVHAVLLGRDSVRARFFLASGAAASLVRTWLRDGVPWGDTLARLHAPPAPEGPRA
jgi:hypothetical protein